MAGARLWRAAAGDRGALSMETIAAARVSVAGSDGADRVEAQRRVSGAAGRLRGFGRSRCQRVQTGSLFGWAGPTARSPARYGFSLRGVLSPSNPILITDLADLSIGEVDLEHVFR